MNPPTREEIERSIPDAEQVYKDATAIQHFETAAALGIVIAAAKNSLLLEDELAREHEARVNAEKSAEVRIREGIDLLDNHTELLNAEKLKVEKLRAALEWSLKNLRALTDFTENDGTAWIRGTRMELVGFVMKYNKAQEALSSTPSDSLSVVRKLGAEMEMLIGVVQANREYHKSSEERGGYPYSAPPYNLLSDANSNAIARAQEALALAKKEGWV